MANPLAIVLAAGKGTRMDSDSPKVLCEALGRPLVDYVLDALRDAGFEKIVVVVGYEAQLVRETLAARQGLLFAEQTEQLGTGHAVQMCREHLEQHDGPVLVLAGDSPLVQAESLRQLLAEYERSHPACILGTLHKEDPTGLGRIVRDENGGFARIVEEKDASEGEKKITEVNMSTYVFDCGRLLESLDGLQNQNSQKEFYLTDCPGILKAAGADVRAMPVLRPCEALSVNTVAQLQIVEEEMRRLGYVGDA